jgi:hypothetical protein
VEEKSWEEFLTTGLLLFINSFLHIFGWVIVLNLDENNKVFKVYPARIVSNRGFTRQEVLRSYGKLTKYMKDNGNKLYNEFIKINKELS